jgi:hypothetical protein
MPATTAPSTTQTLKADIERRQREVAAVARSISRDTGRDVHIEHVVAMWDLIPPDSPAWTAAHNLLAMFDPGTQYDGSDTARIDRLGILAEPMAELANAAMDASFEVDEDNRGRSFYRMEHALEELQRRIRVFAPTESEAS